VSSFVFLLNQNNTKIGLLLRAYGFDGFFLLRKSKVLKNLPNAKIFSCKNAISLQNTKSPQKN
jgi:hypothetical protein